MVQNASSSLGIPSISLASDAGAESVSCRSDLSSPAVWHPVAPDGTISSRALIYQRHNDEFALGLQSTYGDETVMSFDGVAHYPTGTHTLR